LNERPAAFGPPRVRPTGTASSSGCAGMAPIKPGEVTWVKPEVGGTPPGPRSGHTISVVEGTAVLFGGCGVEGKESAAVYNETYLLHLTEETPRWELMDAIGDVPEPRWRHTATALPDAQTVLCFGGLCRGRRYNDTCTLYLPKKEWTYKECAGTPPHARSHHTATFVEPGEAGGTLGGVSGQLLICGGFGGPSASYRDFLLDIHLLTIETWTWGKVDETKGPAPAPRSDHTACVSRGRLYILGGRTWATKTHTGFLEDMQVLDLRTWRWLDPPAPVEEAAGADEDSEAMPAWPALGGPRWNHCSALIESVPHPYLFVFGGQAGTRTFTSELKTVQIGDLDAPLDWFTAPSAGAPPEAREDCGFAYDPATASVVLFGGWRQKWLSDLCFLNVAGIVGPAYAVHSISPRSGPVSGSAPVTIGGLRFKPSQRIQVKFTDGRHETTVAGTFESETAISARTPVLEKMVQGEVNVSVSIDGEPFTVNRCIYAPFLNSRANRCLAFGPGVYGKARVGVEHTFMLQTKDAAGNNRSTGGDPITVQITGPEELAAPVKAMVEDSEDGRYRITYTPPLAGDYSVVVHLNEVAFGTEEDVEASRMPVRASPFAMHAEDVWRPLRAAGIAPSARSRIAATVLAGTKLVVFGFTEVDLAGDEDAEGLGEDGNDDAVDAALAEVDGDGGGEDPAQAVDHEAGGVSPTPQPRDAEAAEGGAAASPAADQGHAAGDGGPQDGGAADASAADEEARRIADADAADEAVPRVRDHQLPQLLPGKAPADAWVLELGEPGAASSFLPTWQYVTDDAGVKALVDEAEATRARQVAALRNLDLPAHLERSLLIPAEARFSSLRPRSADLEAVAPEPRGAFETHVVGDCVYIYGGVSVDGLHDDVWRLRPVPAAAGEAAAARRGTGGPSVPGLSHKWKWELVYGGLARQPGQHGPPIYAFGSSRRAAPTALDPGVSVPHLRLFELSRGVLGDLFDLARVLDVSGLERRDGFNEAVARHAEAELAKADEMARRLHVGLHKQLPGAPEGALHDDETVDEASLHRVMRALHDVRVYGDALDFNIEQLREAYLHLERAAVNAAGLNADGTAPAPSAAAMLARKNLGKVEAAADTWAAAKKVAPAVKKAIKHHAEAEGLQVAERVRALGVRVSEWREGFRAGAVTRYETGVNEAYVTCEAAHTELEELHTEYGAVLELAEICENTEAAEGLRRALDDARAELVVLKGLWDLAAVVEAFIADWEETLWTNIDTAAMEEETKQLSKALRGQDKRLREMPVYKSLEQSIKNFSIALPCVGDLKVPAMRDRHWMQLARITEKEIPLPFPEDFALSHLLALQLHKFVDDVGEVVDRAVKEDKMEQQLAKLSSVWETVEFAFEQHRDTDVMLMSMKEEDFDALEENQLLVQGMMASKYLDTFEEEVTRWQRELSNVSDVLTTMGEVQRRWAYLETLFIGSDEVKKELPEDAERFTGIDAMFKTCLAGVLEEKNAVRASNRPGLIADLNDMSDKLELCEKALADFLESKKRIFPRFYFVATAMLLDILSNGNRPNVVAQHVNTLLQGVKSLELSGDPPSVVEAMTSNEGEVVPFSKTGSLPLKGKVEIYLNDLITKVRDELHTQLKLALEDYRTGGRPRTEWLFDHVAQMVLVTTQIEWTENTEKAFDKLAAGNASAMKKYSDEQVEMLSGLIVLVQGKLEGLQRRKIMNMITLETHSRDINVMLINDQITHKDNFKWASQLKTKWLSYPDAAAPVDCHIFNCDAHFQYSYEYLGNAGRLVITPLTDRIYTTATQACHLVLGCAPAGPAGTGKTETTKDLSAQLGKAVYVINCGPEMDYRTMGDIFKGLASAGAWGCFDEFNRLLAEVLSVCSTQYKSVLDAIRADSTTYRMEGVDYTLHPDGCMAFITMNPGYLGRTELPESLKVLFRPVTVMVPDMQMIMENMLMAEGYTTANTLAKKFFTLYRLLKDLLSPQMHYDWGLRAIKSVLVVAGGFKRGEPDQPEGGLLMRALRDFNLPKIVEDDMVVFMGLLKDLWPDVFDSMPRKRDYDFEGLVAQVARESKLQASEYFIQNVVDLQDLLDIRHCVFELGSSGNNKTKTWQTLAKVWTKGGVRGKTTFRDINPKAITPNELYGYVNMATREWKDGLLSSTMREMANQPDTNPKWIILDGDLDANWIENMNSVMDDNRLLTLASNERIRLLPHMRLIFEIRDLAYASPATVTRAGILFISEMRQWKNFVKSWIEHFRDNEAANVTPDNRQARAAKLEELFDKYCESTMLEIFKSFKTVVPILDFNMVQTLCFFLEGLLVEENVGRTAERFETFFVYAAVWAFGSAMSVTSGVDYRKRFSIWWKETWKTIKFPHRGEVFDYHVDPKKGEFAAWAEIVPEITYSSTTPMSAVTVPTGETVAITFWLDNLMPRKHAAMLVGNAGCGKTAIINGKLRKIGDDYMSSTVNINYYTNSSLFLKVLEGPLEKKAGKNYGPPGSKKLVYFVDDLNMAALDKYNTASNISLMRQHLAYGHVYDMSKLTQKVLLNTQYLAAMNPTAGSFVVNPRLQRLFATFAVGFPGAEALTTIYSTFLNGHLANFSKEIAGDEMGKKVVQAALQLHRKVATTFRKTAQNFHYEFNIRHMAGVFQGILMGKAEQIEESLQLAQLWLHESERVYGDRLVSPQDLKKYKDLAAETAKKIFKEMSPTSLMVEPLFFVHFAHGIGEKQYDRLPNFAELSTLLTQALTEYNETNAVMNLVLFEDAMRHVCRISRIIESPGGHALLVGVGGSGKQSLSKLAAFVSGFTLKQVVISATYGVNELKADLQQMYRKSGLKSEGLVFLFTDQQIADERFLVYINDLLSSGHIPGLFPPEDVDDIINTMRPFVKRAGLADTRDNAWNLFISQVRENLHMVLCFSPIGEPIKVRTRRFPALVNCVTIDWFQPWPEEALLSVSKRFLEDMDLGTDAEKTNIINFMPYSFIAVNQASASFIEREKRYNWTTPKSFLELIALYKSMLTKRRKDTNDGITRLSNGVTKLEATASEVSQLEEELKVKQVEVEEKKLKCDEMIPRLETEKTKASDEMKRASEIAQQASEKEVAVGDMKEKIDRDLENAEPALEKAAAALDSLNKKDLGELKSLAKPPAGIDDVTGACVYLLHEGGKGKIDASWKASQQMMKDVNKFLEELLHFKAKIDAGKVPKNNFKNIRPLLEKDWFNVDTMRTKSAAAAGLCDWVLNITVYWDINENVEPMREAAANAVVQLEEAIQAKDEALKAAEAAKQQVAELTAAFNEAVAEKEAVEAEAEACERKLGLAQRLMAALGSEGERWRQGIEGMKVELGLLAGNALLAAAFVSYSGSFNRFFREGLLDDKFKPYLQGTIPAAKGVPIPMSPGADPLKILTNEAEIAQWSSDGLPSDRTSVENGTIVTNCARWPLMIDPQLQGITWIRRKEERRGLHVVRLGQRQLLSKLENALVTGKPIVIENIQINIDAVLAPVIGRQVLRRGRTVFVKLGDKEVDYHPDFRLFLQTKLSNPHYPPEVQAETTLINFMVTEDGLEDQLLALTVQKERPDLEESKMELISQMNAFKIKTKELEDGILEQLANAEGDVLENLALIENLEDSKRVALEIADKVKVAEVTEVEINAARELYRDAATRGSMMFFLLSGLNRVHSFHHYSLNSFVAVFERAVTGRRGKLVWNEEAVMSNIAPEKLKRALKVEAAEAKKEELRNDPDKFDARLAYLVEEITFKTFSYARRGLFERHKLILATQLLLAIMRREGELEPVEGEYLIMGKKALTPPHMTARVQEYLSDLQWAAACALKEVEAFRTLPEDLELATDAWREWLDAERPEEVELPGEWDKRCTPFQKILLLRALRSDRVTTAIASFVEERLGVRYMQQDAFSMDDAFNDSSRSLPLFFVLFPGVDPGAQLEALGRKLGFTEDRGNFVPISMGQGQEKHAENTLDRFTRDGGWVFLQNIHLMQSWLPTLERKLEMAAEGHEDFRAFLSAEPPPLPDMQTVPEGIMQSSVKVANEPPTDLKATLRSSYALFDQSTLDASSKKFAHRPMLFATCFFHALVLGRRKFGFQGFSRNYPFNNGDLTVCASVLHNYLEAADAGAVPWEDVRYIFGEIMYGGHITDTWDRRVTNTYLDVLLQSELIDEKTDFELTRGYAPMLEGSYVDYRNYIESALPAESPVLFGLHPNAEIGLLISVCDSVFEAVFTLQGGGGGGDGGAAAAGGGKESVVKAILEDFESRLPDEFVMIDIKGRVREKTPYVVCVLQELERMNAVAGLMRRELTELQLGLSGALNISDAMDMLITNLHTNKVPPGWLKVCGQIGPTGTYNRKSLSLWFTDLLVRYRQLKEWAEDPQVLPPCVWLSGLFNPMGYITACLQVTARAKSLPLDSMVISTEVLEVGPDGIDEQPEEGTYVHGLFMEGARWDTEENTITDSHPKELFPPMPVIHVRGITAEEVDDEGAYQCPVYTTRIRGPTFTFAAPLRTVKPPYTWVLAGVCLVMQSD